ncbi:MAG: carboxypeptidase regulatory-like domain-containing protein [Pirellulaceae bacterium]|nr:carboxypeptidase regulatory-like domain-containing protein [Pirellulaceae bacterium]
MKTIICVVTYMAIALSSIGLVSSCFAGCREDDKQRVDFDLRTNDECLQSISNLTFQLKDDRGNLLPVQTCEIIAQISSSENADMLDKRLTLRLESNGVLTIPEPYPSQGRIRIWVTVDDPELGAFKGHRNVAFKYSNLDDQESSAANDLELSSCPVISGVVTDAATGEPVMNAEVTTIHWGHHSSYANWDDAVRTDSRGSYRILDSFHKGVAVRHPDYEENYYETEKREVDFKLDQLVSCRIRVVEPNGTAIPNVTLQSGVVTDAEGRGEVRVLPGSDKSFSIYHPHFRTEDVSVSRLHPSEELVVGMLKLPSLRGRILDETGLPLAQGKVEVLFEGGYMLGDYHDADGPQADGTWSLKGWQFDSNKTVGRLRVSVENQVRLVQAFNRDEARDRLIESRLSTGHRLQAKLVAKHTLSTKLLPVAFLYQAGSGAYWSAVKPSDNGRIEFGNLPNGSYTLRLAHPEKLTLRGLSSVSLADVMRNGPVQPIRAIRVDFSTNFQIQNADVDLGEIDMDALGLTPGTVVGQVFATPDESTPLPGWFGYLCQENPGFNTADILEYYLEFHMDQQGRFRIDNCPPGTYMIRISDQPDSSSGEFQVTVTSGKTTEVQVFNSADRKR